MEQTYAQKKARARDKAIEWQLLFASNNALHMSELADYGAYFSKLGKRYGLLKEFRENGIC